MADTLVIDDHDRTGYRIKWFLEEEADLGAVLGETLYTSTALAKAKTDDWDHIAATIAVGATEGVEHDRDGYYWESRKHAQAALRAAKAVLKDKSRKPWPEWAVKAKAAGWKAPKGWAP